MSISFSFDIGHSSIGWAALKVDSTEPEVLGCGVVAFQPKDCQNQKRAGFRRQRRHIAATRNRIKRLEAFLQKAGVLSAADVTYCRENPHPWPWLLAAQVLRGERKLEERELWAIIRWYAHNRGYDGNALWAGEDADKDDIKKVKAARDLMEEHKTNTMCETVCVFLDADPTSTANPNLKKYFKGENVAFPRSTVIAEMRKILKTHVGELANITEPFIKALLDDWKCSKVAGFDAKLPQRYFGGLLFGQLKPRFENRIIPKCRLTGEKTPSKHSREFYRYRWAMFMNNLRVASDQGLPPRPLRVAERCALDKIMHEKGYLIKSDLTKALKKSLKLEPVNLEAMLLVPEMENALTLDPALREVSGNKHLKKVWPLVPDERKRVFLNQLFHSRNFRGKPPSIGQWKIRLAEDGAAIEKFDEVFPEIFEAESEKLAKKNLTLTQQEFLDRPIHLSKRASGRAPYTRKKLLDAVACVMRDEDPRSHGGPLEETEEARSRQQNESIDRNSNNHLVRHRLKIFTRTLDDLVKRYANDDPASVAWVGVEVIRDLVQFSGKTEKEKAKILSDQLSHHRKIVKILEEKRESTGGNWEINIGLIHKVRIADDMGWKCPYTGNDYNLNNIIHGKVELDHIIPYSKRPTNALHALTLTFPEVNRQKGARTALEYIEDPQNEPPHSPNQFKKFVENLKKKNGPSKDDEMRCRKRKIALLTPHYEKYGKGAGTNEADEGEVVDGFTEGSLSQTSYLNKLAVQETSRWFTECLGSEVNSPPVVQLPGSVTAATRRKWKLFGQLNEVCPETRNKAKADVRKITHLHHAIDAIAIGLAVHYFPKEDGRLHTLLSRRSIRNPDDQAYLKKKLGDLICFCNNGCWELRDLSPCVKEQISERLLEKKVVRHIPRTMRGLRVQENIWGVEGEDPDDDTKLRISMKSRGEDGKKSKSKNKSERKTKLLGYRPNEASEGKLKQLKGVLIVEYNFGVALDPEPKVISYQQVWKQISELKEANKGRPVRIIRNGDIIRIPRGQRYKGVWRVHSVKDKAIGPVLNLASPEFVNLERTLKMDRERESEDGNNPRAKEDVRLRTLLKDGLEILNCDYAGHVR